MCDCSDGFICIDLRTKSENSFDLIALSGSKLMNELTENLYSKGNKYQPHTSSFNCETRGHQPVHFD